MRKLGHLQALRALAASAVVAGHVWSGLIERGLAAEDGLRLTWMTGQIGVTLFFVLSGFILARASAEDFGRPGAPGAPGAFLLRRVIRIAPMYALVTLIAVGQHALRGAPAPLADVVRSLLFIPYRAEGAEAVRPLVGHGLTLNYEMAFYALFALALALPRRLGAAAVLAGLAATVALGALLRPLLPYADPRTGLEAATDPILLRFGAGVLLASLRLHPPRVAARWPLLLATAAMAGLLIAFAALGARFPLSWGWQAAVTAAAALAVWLCAHAETGRPTRLARLLQRAGDASYSTYLFQSFGIRLGLIGLTLLPTGLRGGWLPVAAGVAGANLLGWAIFRWVERPLTDRLRAWADRARPRPRARVATVAPPA